MRSRPRARARATAISNAALIAALALLIVATLAVVSGCAKSDARMTDDIASEPEAVVVRVAPLLTEHPLYAEVEQLSARLSTVGEPPDVREIRQFMSAPLGRTLIGPPRSPEHRFERLTSWEAEADASVMARLREAEETLGSWPQPVLTKTESRLSRKAERREREIENEAALAEMRTELRAIERRKGELAELRQLAESEDREEAARALDRQAQLWREIAAEAEATQQEARRRLRELRLEHEREMAEALASARAEAEEERAEHLARLRRGGDDVRGQLPAAVEAATSIVEPPSEADEGPAPPDTTQLADLVREVEKAQQAAYQRRINRLVEARDRLLRQIALGTRTAVRAVAIRNGIGVRFPEEAGGDLREATEEFRPLLREYWAARPATSGGGKHSND